MGCSLRLAKLALSSVVILSGVVACGAGDESPPAPEKKEQQQVTTTDQLGFEASAATKDDTGIAKWGFEMDAESMRTTFRGYDAAGALIVTVERSTENLDPSNETHVRTTTTMTGKFTGSKRVQSIEIPVPEDQDAPPGSVAVAVNFEENTFTEGSVEKKILDHLANDTKTQEHQTMVDGRPAGSLFGQALHPTNGPLIKTCMRLLEACYQPTREYENAIAGQESACSGSELIGKPVVGGIVAGGTGALLGSVVPALGTAIGAVGGAAVGVVGGFGSAAYGCWSSGRAVRSATAGLRQCMREKNVSCP
jgi:hypothetical protein